MERQRGLENQKVYVVGALIALCFFWGGTGFLAWSAHLGRFWGSDTVLLVTECGGYLVQCLGVALYALTVKRRPKIAFSRRLLPAVELVFLLSLLLSAAGRTLPLVLAGGLAANLVCGYVQGLYLTCLTCSVPRRYRGRTFAFSYAAGAVGTYAASSLSGGTLDSIGVFAAIGVAIGLTLPLAGRAMPAPAERDPPLSAANAMEDKGYFRRLFGQMCLLIFLLNLLYKTSFYATELIYISGVLPVEFVRAFSAIGLVIAGIVNDKDRKYGLITCLLSLLFPLLCLTLIELPGTAAILCILCFILLSFIMVYRAVSVSDMAGKDVLLLPFAGLGLGVGRLGESAGTLLGYSLRSRQTLLIGGLSVLFVAVVLFAFPLYQKLYADVPTEDQKAEKAFADFESRYELTSREREIFRLLISGKTNGELADALYVSESTIKFHVGHILKKTQCANRTELIKKYRAGLYARELR